VGGVPCYETIWGSLSGKPSVTALRFGRPGLDTERRSDDGSCQRERKG
jgi:hypothetical protein